MTTTHMLETAGAEIAYDVRGPLPTADGRPPLFMIAQPMDASGFATLASHFPDRTVVTYDPRGLGRSVRKDGRVDHAPTVQAGDVHAVPVHRDTVELDARVGGRQRFAMVSDEDRRSSVLRRLGHRPRRGRVLEADVARGNHPGHHLDREPARPNRRVLVAEPARRLGVAHHDRDAAQTLVVLVDERPSADEVAAVAQIGSEGEMPILELGRLLVRELRCIGPTHEQHERVPVELHAAN
jgi:hypothetical protein